ncbi:hypothetical protein P3X46_008459 [Hevea brasiliensis]|uniref:Uncharacterized protein n=1 Tax=Hevea brasiliensis TaxID=3981 RepID=A0ABQ9MJS3_HEVBR|nr:uncharacterized protein LOC110656914 isoform X2 [Hevea brasiliensis]XP_058002786.1 uncharacterized protein LOC110656914 isoform X2 [Hevea brasiliensis]KAJ9180183.1 hypothetical protein P3X46_008459 [Hevea brasiliensis]
MSKKKLSHLFQNPNQDIPHEDSRTPALNRHQSSMEDPEEKIQHLKSLNSMLLKETLERRQQIESLVQAKRGLETELTRTSIEKTDLENLLTRSTEDRLSLEIEKGLFCVFIETRMNEMGVVAEGLLREKGEKEIESVFLKTEVNGLLENLENERQKLSWACRDRDMLRFDLDNWVNEANGLREKLIEMEEKERKTAEDIRILKVHYAQSIKQNKELEEEIEKVKNLTDFAEKKLAEKEKEIEDLNREMDDIVRKKTEIEMENSGQKVKITGLEKYVSELNEIISSLRGEEGVLREKVLELEKSCHEAIEKAKVIAMEVDVLMEEKQQKDITIETLMEEMHSSDNIIKTMNIEVKDKDGLIEKLMREKKETDDVKVSKESAIAELHKELAGLRDATSAMQKSIKNQEDKNKQLASEVSHYRDAFEQVRLERDKAQVDLDEEKTNSISLSSKVLEMKKRIEETVKETAKKKKEHAGLFEEKKEMERQVGLLKKEKDLMQKNLYEAQQEIDDLRSKMESTAINSERALSMLKNTAASLGLSNDGKEEVIIIEKKLEGVIEPYETELEVIKDAFRNKETVVEEMKQQVKFLQNSLADAHKKKNLWAIVSSAATFLAAAYVAYVAKVR